MPQPPPRFPFLPLLPYPVDEDPGHVFVRGVQRLGQLGVAVHQVSPCVPLHAGGDAVRVQLRGVDLQALGGDGEGGTHREVRGMGTSPRHGGWGKGHTAFRFLVTELPDSRQKMTGK